MINFEKTAKKHSVYKGFGSVRKIESNTKTLKCCGDV